MRKESIPACLSKVDVVVGANVKSRRLGLRIRSADVASSLGVETDTLQNMEEGRARISAAQLQTLCSLLQTSPAEIYKGIENAV